MPSSAGKKKGAAREPLGELVAILARRIVRAGRHRRVVRCRAREDPVFVGADGVERAEVEVPRRAVAYARGRAVAALTSFPDKISPDMVVRQLRSASRARDVVDRRLLFAFFF